MSAPRSNERANAPRSNERATARRLAGLVPVVRMRGRDVDERGRVSSPLELLFDLTFVAAVSAAVGPLAHAIEVDHVAEGIAPLLMVFFAIWWAWLNFTWFASAYDTDDVPYRLLTMVQMGGVLVLAAGVQQAFEVGDFTLPTIGYAIMRFAMVAQWLRVAASDPESRATALRYAIGISIVQVLWIVRLFVTQGFPGWLLVVVFVLLALCEMAVPLVAERPRLTQWHPHHIAERYGLFVIILLGESVLASTVAVQQIVNAGAATGLFVLLAASALALLFGLWWIYFLEPAHEGLERRRSLSFWWGYGHYGIFVALTAAGAGLEAAVVSMEGHEGVDPTVVGYGVAVPVAVFLVLMWGLYRPLTGPTVIPPAVSLGAAAVVLLLPLAAHSVGIAVTILLIALTVAAVVATTIVYRRFRPPVSVD